MLKMNLFWSFNVETYCLLNDRISIACYFEKMLFLELITIEFVWFFALTMRSND